MKFSRLVESGFKKFIPAPFTLAVLLSLLTMILALGFTEQTGVKGAFEILDHWQSGMWDPSLLVFAVQMMLILVLGHILVLSEPVSKLTSRLTSLVHNNSSAILLVSFSTMLVAFFNWGLGLIFGAIMARKVAEAAGERNFPINYPLLGAAGYAGLMVWHGGMSGSAPLKAAENGHLQQLLQNNIPLASQLPDFISTEYTIFSSWNLIIFAILLLLVPGILYLVSRFTSAKPVRMPRNVETKKSIKVSGAENLDRSPVLKMAFGLLLLAAFFVSYSENIASGNLTPNMLYFFMLSLGILLHSSFKSFLEALDEAIVGAGAILIQFPLYFGVMGIMRETGMVNEIAMFFVGIATQVSLPIYTFFSAGLVNIFVPSGGGQWAIQGPVVIESAIHLGVPLNKIIMAFAYGDQITNMLQPFWALPLLAITRLKAGEILPYTLLMMITGTLVYVGALLLL